MNDSRESMWERTQLGINGIPDILRSKMPVYLDAARSKISQPPSRLYTVGCGDSYYCGLAALPAVEGWSRLPVAVLESLEFSHYAFSNAPQDALVIGVSNSGRVARTYEAMVRAAERHIPTLAVTYRGADTEFARVSDAVLISDYDDTGLGVGTGSYVASLLAIYAVGLRLGELTGTLTNSDVSSICEKIADTGDIVASSFESSRRALADLVATISLDSKMFILGAGPSYGSALVGQAKMIEMCLHNTVAQELEEWAHEQLFLCGPGTWTGLVAPSGMSVTRVQEQLDAIKELGGRSWALCSASEVGVLRRAEHAVTWQGPVDELLSPLVTGPLLMQLACSLAIRNGVTMLGFDDEVRKNVNARQIFESEIVG